MTEESEISSSNIQDDTIIIREAKPDLEEGLVMAQFFDEASEGFFFKMLGIKTYEIIADAFVKSNNEYSFENVLMIEYKGKIVGKVLSRFLGPCGKEDYYLQSIAVSSQMRGKGLGQRLLKHSGEIAIKKGSKTLSLDVSSKNKNAINSYKKFGMEVFSVWPNFIKLPPVFTRMMKEL